MNISNVSASGDSTPTAQPGKPNKSRASDTADTALAETIERIVAQAGPKLMVALPLGLGKPNDLINALCARVSADASLSMVLYTALSLDLPQPKEGLESAFAQPFIARHFGADYPVLEYLRQLKNATLCPRIRVHEFYFQSGAWLGCAQAQRDYVSLNYTHVARELARLGVNVMLHLVARRNDPIKGDRLSLSCNPDVTLDALDALHRAGKPKPLIVCAVHPALPFLGFDAEVPLDFADILLDVAQADDSAHTLFALPREPVALHEYAIGLHASALVRDGGTLQIGIGALSDALVYALIQRHTKNPDYARALSALRGDSLPGACMLARAETAALASEYGGEARFAQGLYGASEMVMDGFMHLREAGILTRRVYDDFALQDLLNRGIVRELTDETTLERLIEAGQIPAMLDQIALDWLMRFGFLDQATALSGGELHFCDGARIGADMLITANRIALSLRMQNRRLVGGRYLHGAFYLGSKLLYHWLRTLKDADFEGLCMTRVSFINELYGGRESLDIAQRSNARFFNTCMMHTLGGAAVSDGLADGRVVSGVGGQYNFVAMAHALPNARSILMLRATREGSGAKPASSSIIWHYGHCTIPRHLRDLVITEYGVADLRGQSDEIVIQRLLAITDARFQAELIAKAKSAGKLAPDFVAPSHWQRNTAAHLATALAPLKLSGNYPRYPFGSDFDAIELALLPALARLKTATQTTAGRLRTLFQALVSGAPNPEHAEKLARLGLANPQRIKEKLLARMLSRYF